jgi:hypothetical protein
MPVKFGCRLSAVAGRLTVLVAFGVACSSTSNNTAPTRTYRMGFNDQSPRGDSASYVNTLNMWMQRADGAIMHLAPPWTALLAGANADSIVLTDQAWKVGLYRSRGFRVWITLDVTDGLDRTAEAPELVALGRSIAEPAVQLLYRKYAIAIDSILGPDYLGLAAETNLIRLAAPANVYAAVVTMTNDAAADIHSRDAARPLYVSLQVDAAWGRLGGASGTYIGVAQDFTDFPFMSAVGLSSYPYLAGYADPADIPDDYYSRIASGHTQPLMVVEGGWSSAAVTGVTSDPAKQARYITRQQTLLANARAIGVFQLEFADLDTTGLHLPPTSILPLFITIGLVSPDLQPKPALSSWDSAFAKPLAP